MKIARMVFNLFSENTYILWEEGETQAAIVDPGMGSEDEFLKVKNFLSENGLSLEMVLLTHQHVDHVLGVGRLVEDYGCKVYGHVGDAEWGEKLEIQARMFNLPYAVKTFTLSDAVSEGDKITLNNEEIQVIHTPGHSPGGLVYYLPETGCAFVGDTIFEGSIGRTDLSGGNYGTLIENIKTKVLTLPADTVLLPGHGGATTVEDEKNYNPFLREL